MVIAVARDILSVVMSSEEEKMGQKEQEEGLWKRTSDPSSTLSLTPTRLLLQLLSLCCTLLDISFDNEEAHRGLGFARADLPIWYCMLATVIFPHASV
ncbi:hypothetical protein BHM03_00004665 [Ensete ventricosum]|nr:hypothetical protein BHM03_00004665 [Ensete ventricosum]